jgi:hypothetical protein
MGKRRDRRVQDLLYLQTATTIPTSPVLGIALYVAGSEVELPHDPADWPYTSVLHAIRDGWRVVKFPELSLLLDDRRTYALGCEFILERSVDPETH